MTERKLRKKVRQIIHGDDYVEPLEFGCEVMVTRISYIGAVQQEVLLFSGVDGLTKMQEYVKTIDQGGGCCSNSEYFEKHEYLNLGKPLQLREILRAFEIKYDFNMHASGMLYVLKDNKWSGVKLDLSKEPSQYSEEKLQAIYDLLN